MIRTTPGLRLVAFSCLFLMIGGVARAQNPTSCTGVGQRANSNGGANSCPNVSGTAYATNFVGTSYATIPASAKTGNFQLSYTGSNLGLLPYAITKVWLTSGVTTIQSVNFGPASVPSLSAGNTLVDYCFYGMNLPTAGTLSLEMTNPQTGVVWGICSYDASCNSACVVVSNPAALPVHFASFMASAGEDGVVLKWATAQEENNKGFAIERRGADGEFVAIGYVGSANVGGNSVSGTVYEFVDRGVGDEERVVAGGGWVAYRIRQEDLDGKYEYSSTVVVNIVSSGVRVYSAEGRVSVGLPVAGFRPCSVVVYDSRGRTLRSLWVSQGGVTTIGGLPGRSVCYVTVSSGGGEVRVRRAVWVE